MTSFALLRPSRSNRLNVLWRVLPGLALAAGLASMGLLVWTVAGHSPMVSPMIVALTFGIILGNLGASGPIFSAGTTIALRPVLRTGIVLLGFRLTLNDLGQLGVSGMVMVVLLVATSFHLIKKVGRFLGVSRELSELIAAGTSICGASAVLGMNTVTRGRDEEVAYAIACVTIFGTLSMVLFPALQPLLGFGDHLFGLWAGASIHEVAQAVGAGWSVSDMAGETATITKLSRVLLLAPMILGVGLIRREGRGGGGALQIPLFVFGFLAAIILNTLLPVPANATQALTFASTFMLAMALGAMGLETRIAALRSESVRPLLLGAFGWLFISAFAVLLVSALKFVS